jgi:hypothetical protein
MIIFNKARLPKIWKITMRMRIIAIIRMHLIAVQIVVELFSQKGYKFIYEVAIKLMANQYRKMMDQVWLIKIVTRWNQEIKS